MGRLQKGWIKKERITEIEKYSIREDHPNSNHNEGLLYWLSSLSNPLLWTSLMVHTVHTLKN